MATFNQRLMNLSNKALKLIKAKVDEKDIVFATSEDIENDEVDLSDFPDFRNLNNSEYCNIIRVFKTDERYFVEAIGKETELKVTAPLSELDAQEAIYLADYLSE